jgi:hypothetical protein
MSADRAGAPGTRATNVTRSATAYGTTPEGEER